MSPRTPSRTAPAFAAPRAAGAARTPFRPRPLRASRHLLLACAALAAFWSAQLPAQEPPARLRAPGEAAAPASLGALLDEARRLLDKGDAPAAYQRLAPQLRWYGGDPEYDHLLGVAAIDSGHPGAAVLAFERVLTVRPDNLQARAELARALLAVREIEAARREFEAIASQRIPPEVQSTIDSYLARIAIAQRGPGLTTRARVEIGAGWDSNVTLGSLGDRWLLAGGTEVTPIGSSRPRETALALWGASIEWQRPIGGGWHWTAGAQATGRSNASAHRLDQTLLDLTGGLRYRTGCHGIDMLGQLQNLRVDGDSFRNAAGVIAQWRCDLDERNQAGAYLQHFAFRFPDQRIRDARRSTVGLTFAHAFKASGNPVLVGNVYTGRERPDADLPQLDHDLYGVRAVLSTSIAPRLRAWLGASWEARDFAGAEPLFDTLRRDRQREAEIGLAFELDRAWVITPRLIHTRNASTLAPNDFRRTQVLVSAQYRFEQ